MRQPPQQAAARRGGAAQRGGGRGLLCEPKGEHLGELFQRVVPLAATPLPRRFSSSPPLLVPPAAVGCLDRGNNTTNGGRDTAGRRSCCGARPVRAASSVLLYVIPAADCSCLTLERATGSCLRRSSSRYSRRVELSRCRPQRAAEAACGRRSRRRHQLPRPHVRGFSKRMCGGRSRTAAAATGNRGIIGPRSGHRFMRAGSLRRADWAPRRKIRAVH